MQNKFVHKDFSDKIEIINDEIDILYADINKYLEETLNEDLSQLYENSMDFDRNTSSIHLCYSSELLEATKFTLEFLEQKAKVFERKKKILEYSTKILQEKLSAFDCK